MLIKKIYGPVTTIERKIVEPESGKFEAELEPIYLVCGIIQENGQKPSLKKHKFQFKDCYISL